MCAGQSESIKKIGTGTGDGVVSGQVHSLACLTAVTMSLEREARSAADIFSALNEIETVIWRFRKLDPEILVEISNETDLVCAEEVESCCIYQIYVRNR